ncbi:MAG: PEP-CTERM sorting domain-containing protein [Planctomycetota bacterium]
MNRTHTTTSRAAFAAAGLAALPGAHAAAGAISGFTWSSGIASVAGVTIVPPVDPNNDNAVGPSLNELVITQKDYTVPGPVDIVFFVEPTGGVTEYTILEGVNNGTGLDFIEYRMVLGFGTGSGFVQSTDLDGLDFDTPDEDLPPNFSTFFPTVSLASEDVLVATGGVFPDGAFSLPPFAFAIDVPDGIAEFTLRQIPRPVPEPASAALLGVALLFARRRRS